MGRGGKKSPSDLRTYNKLGQDLGGYKPPFDRRVHAMGVACPTCRVGVEELCVRADGLPMANGASHGVRRRMAIRAGL
jgi:hypothetical protein